MNIKSFLLFIVFTFALLLSVPAFCQDAATASPPDSYSISPPASTYSAPDAANNPDKAAATAIASNFILSSALKFPWIASVFVVIGAFRCLFKPIMSLIDNYVKSNCTPEQYGRLQHFESGPVYKFISFLFDFLGSVKLPTIGVKPSSATIGAVASLIVASLFMFTGCAHITGDPIVVRAEQTQSIAYSTFDTFLKIDDANRDFWKTNAPASHQFAEYLRAPVPDGTNTVPRGISYINALDRVKLAYKSGKATSNEVITVLATVETAVGQSQQLISQSAQPSNH